MALSKSDVERKRERRIERKKKIDKLTNWYMINLSWGVLGFIALGVVENAYGSASTVLTAPIAMRTIGVILAVLSVALFVLGKMKNIKRATNYGIFSGVAALCSLWIGFYAVMRNVFSAIVPALSSLRSEWWYAWGPRYLLVIYLVVAFIVVSVKTALAAKGK